MVKGIFQHIADHHIQWWCRWSSHKVVTLNFWIKNGFGADSTASSQFLTLIYIFQKCQVCVILYINNDCFIFFFSSSTHSCRSPLWSTIKTSQRSQSAPWQPYTGWARRWAWLWDASWLSGRPSPQRTKSWRMRWDKPVSRHAEQVGLFGCILLSTFHLNAWLSFSVLDKMETLQIYVAEPCKDASS